MKRFIIDGNAFSTLEDFASHFSSIVLAGYPWQGNLDTLNDILRGGFGTPDEGFELVWLNSDRSRQLLGHTETARQLEKRLQRCHPANRSQVETELRAARAGTGTTVFDWLVAIVREHGPGGSEAQDNVFLLLQ